MAKHDRPQTVKSIVINFWSMVTIILPIVIILRFDLLWDLIMVWAALTAVMFVVPPLGWIRPHPYSDFYWNRMRGEPSGSRGKVERRLCDGGDGRVRYQRRGEFPGRQQQDLALIINCSPSNFNEQETVVSTLRFGSRARRIQNKAVVNETKSVEGLGVRLRHVAGYASAISQRGQSLARSPSKTQPELHKRRNHSTATTETAIPGETATEEVTEEATDSNVSETVGGDDVAKKGEGAPELTGDVVMLSKVASNSVEREDRLPPEGFVPAEEMETFDFSALQSADIPEEALAMVVDREERWREREADMIQGLWKYMNRAQGEAFMRRTEKYADETKLSNRVGLSQDKVEPLMRSQEKRQAFDIHKYGKSVLTKVASMLAPAERANAQKAVKGAEKKAEHAPEGSSRGGDEKGVDGEPEVSLVDFGAVVNGKECFDVCRIFLASLQLRNQIRMVDFAGDWMVIGAAATDEFMEIDDDAVDEFMDIDDDAVDESMDIDDEDGVDVMDTSG